MPRTKGSKNKVGPFKDALRIAVTEPHKLKDGSKGTKLRAIAEKLADFALAGEPWAIKEVVDRMDGKAPQGIDLSTEGEMSVTFKTVYESDTGGKE